MPCHCGRRPAISLCILMRFRVRQGMTPLFSTTCVPTTKNGWSLLVPIRNLALHPDEIPCQARDDIGKVMRFRIAHRMTKGMVMRFRNFISK